MEVSWYLRFPRQDILEALVDTRTVGQIRHHTGAVAGWNLDVEDRGEHSLVRLRRAEKEA
ncbi:hypothetical protein [Desulfohalovibrio reitneri]|uniref:hypothetical protein n=1 Tax=Desulfohalovibrio reitneri TaxID=1307759 RepID=UPI001F29879A|nr:hypothetical protein [Desulfohalovibrio reitneri]